jgi:Rad3-related DNA helicase
MSTAAATKPPAAGTPRRETAARTTSSSPAAANRTPTRNPAPTTNGTGTPGKKGSVRSGVNGAPVSARASVRKPAAPSALSSNASQADTSDDDAREEQAAFVHDLKERLQKAETDAEERHKQVEVLNARLNEALTEQAKLEERAHEEEEKVESLENVKREITRQHRELEGIYEAERAAAMKDKEATQTREEELQETIQRLKEAMSSKSGQPDSDENDVSRPCKSTLTPATSHGANHVQHTSAITPPAQTPRRTSRPPDPLPRLRRSTAATRGATLSSSTKRTRSSKVCVSSSPNTRSSC